MIEDEKRRVYYSGFWYTCGIFANPNSLTQNAVKVRISQVLDELRLLSLIYDEIYVPRSHFLTSFHEAHRDFITGVIENSDFKWLTKNGFLVSSSSPGTDSKGDTDRIFERTHHVGWLCPTVSTNDRTIISEICPIKVDSSAEASNSLQGYKKMALTLEQARNVHGLTDLIARSTYRNIEFFHEKFLNLLRNSSLPDNVKEEFWRATNEIYLSNIGNELGKILVPHVDVEPQFPRDIGGDSRLYNADTLRIIMNALIGQKKYLSWMNKNINEALFFKFDSNNVRFQEWKEFQSAYFKLLTVFDKLLNDIRRSQNIEIPSVSLAIASEMSSISESWRGDVISAFVQVAEGVSQMGDPFFGTVTKASTAGLNGLLNKFIRYCVLHIKYKSISDFLRNL